MEHDEIILDQKLNPRNKGTRYGMKTSNTVKYNRVSDRSYRQFSGEITYIMPDETVTLPLDKRKNWEIVTSFEDSDVNVRVVEMDFSSLGEKKADKRSKRKLYPDEQPEPAAPVMFNGSNRKGFFVREKRRPGKRGVARKERRAASDGEENSDSSSAEEREEGHQEHNKEVVVCVLKRGKRQNDRDWRKGYAGCNCEYCTGVEKNQSAKNRNDLRQELISDLRMSKASTTTIDDL